MNSVGESIKTWMKENGISQNKIADDLGVSQPYVARILSGVSAIGKSTAHKLSALYGFSYSYILTGEGSLFPNNDKEIVERAKEDMESVPEIPYDIQLVKEKALNETLKTQIEFLNTQLQEAYKEIARLKYELENK